MHGKLKKSAKNNQGDTGTITIKSTWHSNALIRIGYLITPETEIYVTGGVRFGKYKLTLSSNGDSASGKKTKVSGLFGAGARYTFPGGFFLGGEYLYQTSTKLKLPKGVEASAKLKGQSIRLVVGMSF